MQKKYLVLCGVLLCIGVQWSLLLEGHKDKPLHTKPHFPCFFFLLHYDNSVCCVGAHEDTLQSALSWMRKSFSSCVKLLNSASVFPLWALAIFNVQPL